MSENANSTPDQREIINCLKLQLQAYFGDTLTKLQKMVLGTRDGDSDLRKFAYAKREIESKVMRILEN